MDRATILQLLSHPVISKMFKDKKGVMRVVRTLCDATAGKKISERRLKEAQEFLLYLLEQVNSLRPQQPVVCGGSMMRVLREGESRLILTASYGSPLLPPEK